MSSGSKPQEKIPVLLLKTKSSPTDAYEDLFSTARPNGGPGFEPVFVPVLHHSFRDDEMRQVDALLRSRRIGPSPDCAYGGLVFTSQRAVEGFAKLVENGKGGLHCPSALEL